MDRLLFILIASGCLAYFALKRRPFDALSVAFFAAIVYFFPGFLGYGAYTAHGVQIARELEPGTYRIMYSVLAFLFAGAFAQDIKRREISYLETRPSGVVDRFVLSILLALCCISLILTIYVVGVDAFSARKGDFNQDLGRAFVVYRNTALVGFVGSVCLRERKWMLAFGALILVELALGFRSFVFMALASALWIKLLRMGPIRVFSGGARYALTGAALVLVTLVAKGYIGGIRRGNLEHLRQNAMSFDYVIYTLSKSEPFAIVNNLNIGYLHGFSQELGEFLKNLVAAFVPFLDVFGFSTASRDFARALFSDVEYGIAFNPWLDVYSAGGWVFLVVFLAVYVLSLRFGNRLLRSRSWVMSAVAVASLVGWAAYIERNAVAYQLTGVRRIVLIGVLCYLLKLVARSAKKGVRQ